MRLPWPQGVMFSLAPAKSCAINGFIARRTDVRKRPFSPSFACPRPVRKRPGRQLLWGSSHREGEVVHLLCARSRFASVDLVSAIALRQPWTLLISLPIRTIEIQPRPVGAWRCVWTR